MDVNQGAAEDWARRAGSVGRRWSDRTQTLGAPRFSDGSAGGSYARYGRQLAGALAELRGHLRSRGVVVETIGRRVSESASNIADVDYEIAEQVRRNGNRIA